jgi:S-adenosylmethionine decarboxylase
VSLHTSGVQLEIGASDVVVTPVPDGTPDLAPSIHRQRLVVEGTCREPIGAEQIAEYLTGLSDVCGMQTLMAPVTHRSDEYGWAGWIHWATSGAHFYAWEDPLFFSVDVYTCKPFDPVAVARYTRDYFDADELVARAF